MASPTAPPTHRQRAEQHLKAVEVARVELAHVYASRRPAADEIGRLQNSIRLGVKLAHVHATLSVGDAIALNGPVTGPALT